MLQFILAGWKTDAAGDHGIGHGAIHHMNDEFSRFLDVPGGVLRLSVRPRPNAQDDQGRLIADYVEETHGGCVPDPLRRNGGHKGNRAGCHIYVIQ